MGHRDGVLRRGETSGRAVLGITSQWALASRAFPRHGQEFHPGLEETFPGRFFLFALLCFAFLGCFYGGIFLFVWVGFFFVSSGS